MDRRIRLDVRPASYGSFMTDDFAEVAFEASKDVEPLCEIVFDLVADWRMASYSGALPSVIPSSLKTFHDAYVNETEPNTGILKFSDAIIGRMAQVTPEVSADPSLQRTLRENLVKISSEIQEIGQKTRIEMSTESVWSKYFEFPAFQLGISSTLRLVLVSVYCSFENFVVRALRLAHNGKPFRITRAKEFQKGFRAAFGDLYDRGWKNSRLEAYRRVRHAFMHAGGRITDELKTVNIPVVIDGDTLHVFPEHIKELYDLLKPAALEIIRSTTFR